MDTRDETAGEMYSRLGIDGRLWAEEMAKRFNLDIGDLLPWTCSMIMAAYDKQQHKIDALNQPQPTADVVERVRLAINHEEPGPWIETRRAKAAIAAMQPSLPQGMTEENVRLFNDAMTLITKSLAGMLTDNSFASPYPEDHRPTTPRWVIAKFAHDHDRRVAYVNDIKHRLDWIRNATESVRIRALSALPGNSVKGVE